ncbi:MAG: response regulator transcription factor [Clostridia bacterium]|nr:response regulator transcription factor [Clostridia bacterium]
MNILIVEDEVSLSNAIKKIMEQHGYLADAVYDGASAIDYATGCAYDLIILDVMLPKLDGFEVVRRLRAGGLQTPILMLTARAATPDKVTGLNSGADDYMTKPFEIEELLARVNALTRRTPGGLVIDTVTFGDLTLNVRNAVLACGNASVQLSRKEFEVLKLLMYHPGTTVTKELLIVKIWGADSEATDNNVEVYISFLRKKLRYLKSQVLIRNIQKIGYRLEAEPA